MLTPYLQSPPVDAASLLHPLGHIIPWDTQVLAEEAMGPGTLTLPVHLWGPPHTPSSPATSMGSQCWVLCSPGVPESLRLAPGRGQRAVPVVGRAPSGFQLTNARRWLPAEELLLWRRLFTAC